MLQQKEYKEKKLILEMEEKQISNERQVQELQLDKRKMENRIKHLENDLSQNQILSEDGESKGELLRQLNEQSTQIDEMAQTINALETEQK